MALVELCEPYLLLFLIANIHENNCFLLITGPFLKTILRQPVNNMLSIQSTNVW